MALDRVAPSCTSERTWVTASLSFGRPVCSSRIVKVRSRVRPEVVIDANWRAKIARSFRLVRLLKPGIFRSFCRPSPLPVTESGISFCAASDPAAASFESESIVPLTRAPVASRAS